MSLRALPQTDCQPASGRYHALVDECCRPAYHFALALTLCSSQAEELVRRGFANLPPERFHDGRVDIFRGVYQEYLAGQRWVSVAYGASSVRDIEVSLLGRLDTAERGIAALFYLARLDHFQIATVLGCAPERVLQVLPQIKASMDRSVADGDIGRRPMPSGMI